MAFTTSSVILLFNRIVEIYSRTHMNTLFGGGGITFIFLGKVIHFQFVLSFGVQSLSLLEFLPFFSVVQSFSMLR